MKEKTDQALIHQIIESDYAAFTELYDRYWKQLSKIALKKIGGEEDDAMLVHYKNLDGEGLYNPRKLPFKLLAEIQFRHTSVGWGSMGHSADYVELAMYGPGAELLKPFVKNTDLHNLMLKATGVLA